MFALLHHTKLIFQLHRNSRYNMVIRYLHHLIGCAVIADSTLFARPSNESSGPDKWYEIFVVSRSNFLKHRHFVFSHKTCQHTTTDSHHNWQKLASIKLPSYQLKIFSGIFGSGLRKRAKLCFATSAPSEKKTRKLLNKACAAQQVYGSIT